MQANKAGQVSTKPRGIFCAQIASVWFSIFYKTKTGCFLLENGRIEFDFGQVFQPNNASNDNTLSTELALCSFGLRPNVAITVLIRYLDVLDFARNDSLRA
jgi:hypothetical protein